MKKILFFCVLLGTSGLSWAMNAQLSQQVVDELVTQTNWAQLCGYIADGEVTFEHVSRYTKNTLDAGDERGHSLFSNLVFYAVSCLMNEEQDRYNDLIFPTSVLGKEHTEKSYKLYVCLGHLISTDKITHSESLVRIYLSRNAECSECEILYAEVQRSIEAEAQIQMARSTGDWCNVAVGATEHKIHRAHVDELSSYEKVQVAKAALQEEENLDTHRLQVLSDLQASLLLDIREKVGNFRLSLMYYPYQYMFGFGGLVAAAGLVWYCCSAKDKKSNDKADKSEAPADELPAELT